MSEDAETKVRTGSVLDGFCAGYFGRDSYGDKRVEAVGPDWCVAREIDSGTPVFAVGDPDELAEYVKVEIPRPQGETSR
jgi:hypothetical protein